MLCLFSRQSSAFLEGAEPALLLMSEWLVPSCPGGLESVGGSRTSGVENRRLRRHAAVLRVSNRSEPASARMPRVSDARLVRIEPGITSGGHPWGC